jgi:hypothetical protein
LIGGGFVQEKTEKPKIARIYRLIGLNWPKFGLIHPKFGGIVEVIEVWKKINFNYKNIRNLE